MEIGPRLRFPCAVTGKGNEKVGGRMNSRELVALSVTVHFGLLWVH